MRSLSVYLLFNKLFPYILNPLYGVCVKSMFNLYRQTDKQIDRQIYRQIDRQIDRKIYRQIDRQIERQIERQIWRQIGKQIHRQTDR